MDYTEFYTVEALYRLPIIDLVKVLMPIVNGHSIIPNNSKATSFVQKFMKELDDKVAALTPYFADLLLTVDTPIDKSGLAKVSKYLSGDYENANWDESRNITVADKAEIIGLYAYHCITAISDRIKSIVESYSRDKTDWRMNSNDIKELHDFSIKYCKRF